MGVWGTDRQDCSSQHLLADPYSRQVPFLRGARETKGGGGAVGGVGGGAGGGVGGVEELWWLRVWGTDQQNCSGSGEEVCCCCYTYPVIFDTSSLEEVCLSFH